METSHSVALRELTIVDSITTKTYFLFLFLQNAGGVKRQSVNGKVRIFLNRWSRKALRVQAAPINCSLLKNKKNKKKRKEGEEQEEEEDEEEGPTVGAPPSSHPDVIISSNPAVHYSEDLLQLFPFFSSTVKPTDGSPSPTISRFFPPSLASPTPLFHPSSSHLLLSPLSFILGPQSHPFSGRPFTLFAFLPSLHSKSHRTTAAMQLPTGRDDGADFLQLGDL